MNTVTVDSLIIHKSKRRKGTRPDRKAAPCSHIRAKNSEIKRYIGEELQPGEIPLSTWLDSYKKRFRSNGYSANNY